MSGKLRAELVDRARQADLLMTALGLNARLKPVTRAEHVGPCLVCNGTDRFSINTKKQAWHCRGCSKGGGDAISLVMHVRGCDFREAVEWLTGEDTEPAPVRVQPQAPAKPDGHDDDARNLRAAARIVADLVSISGTPGERYLRRGPQDRCGRDRRRARADRRDRLASEQSISTSPEIPNAAILPIRFTGASSAASSAS